MRSLMDSTGIYMSTVLEKSHIMYNDYITKEIDEPSAMKIVFSQSVHTGGVILEIFVFVNNSWLKESTKIKHSKIYFHQIFATVNFYSLFKLGITCKLQ